MEPKRGGLRGLSPFSPGDLAGGSRRAFDSEPTNRRGAPRFVLDQIDTDGNICSHAQLQFHPHGARSGQAVDRLRTRSGHVALDDGVNFFEWARELWPAPRWSVELDPWQLSAARVRRMILRPVFSDAAISESTSGDGGAGKVFKAGTRPCFAGDNPPSPLHPRRATMDAAGPPGRILPPGGFAPGGGAAGAA